MKILAKSEIIRLDSKKNRDLLDGLTNDMLQQTWENYPEYDEDEAYECTLDHVILVITKMDDGDEPMYSNLLPFANRNNKYFCKLVKDYVSNHYDDYNWYEM